jgi:hypothetical protein
MRAALLLGAHPKKAAKVGPLVRIGDGKWRVVVTGLIDSVLSLCYGPPLTSEYHNIGKETIIYGPAIVYIEIVSPGTEEHLSVCLERA